MTWLHVLVLAIVATTLAGCELVGDIFQAGAWVGAIAVILVLLLVGVGIAKIRG